MQGPVMQSESDPRRQTKNSKKAVASGNINLINNRCLHITSVIKWCQALVRQPYFYSLSRNTRDFNHEIHAQSEARFHREIRAQSEARFHREHNLAMKNRSYRKFRKELPINGLQRKPYYDYEVREAFLIIKASGGSQPRKEEGASPPAWRSKNARRSWMSHFIFG